MAGGRAVFHQFDQSAPSSSDPQMRPDFYNWEHRPFCIALIEDLSCVDTKQGVIIDTAHFVNHALESLQHPAPLDDE
ncbi:hypothetical protein [Phyllobacterium sp. SB3]|uniref:hypothetical protein n=1 Tax=Phyllobacterium sp. SB3 TaxID=3156073 RepID=UPI0032AFEF98